MGGFAQVEIALNRAAFATFMGLGSFTPCAARYYQTQTSTANPTNFALNDKLANPGPGATSQTFDSCSATLPVPVELMKFDVD